VVPTGRALTVSVYVWASAVFAEWANAILAVVKVGIEKRLAVVLAGEYVTWYSIEDAQSTLVVAVNVMIFAGSVITFWLYPSIDDKLMLMLQTAGLEIALSTVTLHPLEAPYIPNPVNS
jgi:hypothetical protein